MRVNREFDEESDKETGRYSRNGQALQGQEMKLRKMREPEKKANVSVQSGEPLISKTGTAHAAQLPQALRSSCQVAYYTH